MSSPADGEVRSVSLPLYRGEEHACPYLPGRVAQYLVTFDPSIDSAVYQKLMDRGFRRSGHVFYVPDCDGCRACEQIRVPVSTFRATRSQRRVWRRNADLRVELQPPRADEARFKLFNRYQHSKHDGRMACEMEDFERYVTSSPIETREMSYWAGERLVGVGLVDLCPDSVSSVYFYYDPDESRRSLGVYSALAEIELCRRSGRPYWYVGYYVRDCASMAYKAQFRPAEILDANGVWQSVTPIDGGLPAET